MISNHYPFVQNQALLIIYGASGPLLHRWQTFTADCTQTAGLGHPHCRWAYVFIKLWCSPYHRPTLSSEGRIWVGPLRWGMRALTMVINFLLSHSNRVWPAAHLGAGPQEMRKRRELVWRMEREGSEVLSEHQTFSSASWGFSPLLFIHWPTKVGSLCYAFGFFMGSYSLQTQNLDAAMATWPSPSVSPLLPM